MEGFKILTSKYPSGFLQVSLTELSYYEHGMKSFRAVKQTPFS